MAWHCVVNEGQFGSVLPVKKYTNNVLSIKKNDKIQNHKRNLIYLKDIGKSMRKKRFKC